MQVIGGEPSRNTSTQRTGSASPPRQRGRTPSPLRLRALAPGSPSPPPSSRQRLYREASPSRHHYYARESSPSRVRPEKAQPTSDRHASPGRVRAAGSQPIVVAAKVCNCRFIPLRIACLQLFCIFLILPFLAQGAKVPSTTTPSGGTGTHLEQTPAKQGPHK